jgi:hypothetical protein
MHRSPLPRVAAFEPPAVAAGARNVVMENVCQDSREPYEPPRIRKIKIVPEELAAAACKKTMVITTICRLGSKLINRLQGS